MAAIRAFSARWGRAPRPTEQVAQAAGVGKATVFHRFGSRSGLMRALMEDRVRKLTEAIENGPPARTRGARHGPESDAGTPTG